MGKIAAQLDRAVAWRRAAGTPGGTTGTRLAAGPGWSVHDVVCTYGPGDRPFEERHGAVAVALVVGGTFRYRSPSSHEVMTPGAMLLGNPGQPFECGHEHAAGDRCIAFRYDPDFFERVVADAGVPRGERRFPVGRLPPARETAALLARATIGLAGCAPLAWEEMALHVAAAALRCAAGRTADRYRTPPQAVSRVTEAVRRIERDPGVGPSLQRLAADAGLSPFHYLRTFAKVTGTTPHQYILRARLREAAARLVRQDDRIIDVALDAGFRDVSTFNRSFRAEFGVSPRTYRRPGGTPAVAAALPKERRQKSIGSR